MKLHRLILPFLLICLHLNIQGQDISVTADYPSVVSTGEQFTITWTINSGGGEFVPPSFDGFYKLMGPQTSYSSSTQIINGKISRETTYSYAYFLQALNPGVFVLPPAAFIYKNRTYSSDSIRIEVTGTGASRQGSSTPGTSGNEISEPVREAKDDIFLNLSVNKKEVYIGEHIVATVKIYTKVDISGISEIKYPGFEGFLRTDLNTPPLTSLQRENVNGTIYGTGIIQQFLIYPQVSGEITIDPAQIKVLVQQKSGRSDPFFGDFFATYTTVPRVVASPAVKIKSRPLPGAKPADFSGIAGKLTLAASLDKDSVRVNDAVNLKITLSGSGNLRLANAPELKLPPDVEVYDPKISDDLKNTTDGTTGKKTFEYLLIPRHHGEYSIPPVSYSYFDVSTKRYERVTTPGLRFYAAKSDQPGTGIAVYGGVSKEDVKYLGKDIRFIDQNPGTLRKPVNILSSKRAFYTVYAAALVLFLAILFARREHVRRNSDIAMVRNRKAARVAGKRLKAAKACLKEGPPDRFYDEILKAIWGYLSDKLNIPAADLSRNRAVESLRERGIGEEQIIRLVSVLDACEFARYSPSSSDAEAARLFDDASDFISYVENLSR